MADKLSDEQIAEWMLEAHDQLAAKHVSATEIMQTLCLTIANKAYRAGQEAMREEADAVDFADELAQTIRDLPISEE